MTEESRPRVYAYTEFHFYCPRCDRSTAGRNMVGSAGTGWETRLEARKALNAHLRTCKEDEKSREVAEARAAVFDRARYVDFPGRAFTERVDRMVEAVRKDERRRLGVEEGWERGVI